MDEQISKSADMSVQGHSWRVEWFGSQGDFIAGKAKEPISLSRCAGLQTRRPKVRFGIAKQSVVEHLQRIGGGHRPHQRLISTRGESVKMFQIRQPMSKAISVAAIFFILAWTQPARADEILVSAAASLTDVLKEIGTGYQTKSKHTVKFNFGPSSG
ncbi:MAG: molybdate ABC transporter substrate-binding protein, partial [Candidatus Binatia bacterium]